MMMMDDILEELDGPASMASPSSVIIPKNKQRVRPVPVTKPSQRRAAVKTKGQQQKAVAPNRILPRQDWSQDHTECPQSDWTIHIYHQWPSTTDVHRDTYYICTHALKKLPPNRVPLFERIFFECLEETGKNESRLIITEESIAKGFGVLLDLLYAKNEDEEMELLSNVKKALALYRIAEYFQAWPLQQKVSTFYESTTKEFKSYFGNHDAKNKKGKENRVLEPTSVNTTRGFMFPAKSKKPSKEFWSPVSITSSSQSTVSTPRWEGQESPPVPPVAVSSMTAHKWRPIQPEKESHPSSKPQSVASSISFLWQGKSNKKEISQKVKKEKTKQHKKRSLLDQRTQQSPTTESEIMEPSALLQVLKQKQELGTEIKQVDSENVSCLVALCIQQNKDKIKRTLFYKLTSKDYIPYIDPEAALQLLIIEAELDFWQDPDNFSSLQSRCIRSLLANWEVTRKKYNSDEEYWNALRKVSPGVLAILLMHTSGTHYGDDDLSSLSYNPDF